MVSRPILRLLVFLFVIGLPVSVFASPVATAAGGGSHIEWQVSVTGHERVVLRVAAPNGDVLTREFATGAQVMLALKDLPELEDGVYNYELTIVPRIPEAVREQLRAARERGDETIQHQILNAAGIQGTTQSGAFTIMNGSIVVPNMVEKPTPRLTPNVASSSKRPGTPVVNDQVIPDDLIVQGSTCVGVDCVNGETFGFDTIRLKEFNTRLQFNDTSTAAGAPTNNWQIRANSQVVGEASFLAFVDQNATDTGETGDIVFAVEAGAPTNTLWVDNTGRLGLRTTAPGLDLHINTGNTPAIRLEQNASGGFTAQTWDIAGNEANFFVRDLTAGSSIMPFRIRPGAPTSAVDINADGQVGFGTGAAENNIHVVEDGAAEIAIENTSGATDVKWFFQVDNDLHKTLKVSREGGGGPVLTVNARNDVNGVTFRVDGSVQATNVVFTSSRELKNELGSVDDRETLARLAALPISKWSLRGDGSGSTHIGPMAEDFHEIFEVGTDEKHISVTDASGVALSAIKGLAALVRERDQEIALLLREMTAMKARLADLESRVRN